MVIYVLLYEVGTDSEGIHSLELSGKTVVLMFQNKDDAERYCLLLEAQDFPCPTVIDIERDEDKVIITVGSGGAFKSGSADLTDKAKKIMAKIAEVNKKGRSEILVSGHTDDVPLTFGSIYRDNWDLAAARSSSVVQELSSTGKLQPERMKAISYGETQP